MTSHRDGRTVGLALASMLFCCTAVSAADPPVEVNACGTTLNGAGFLAANLDCTGFPTTAVTISNGSLDLAGYTLTGGDHIGIECLAKCTVFSSAPGGTITGAKRDGITVGDGLGNGGKLIVHDLTISNNGSPDTAIPGRNGPDAGIKIWSGGSAKVTNVLFTQNVGDGLQDVGSAKAKVLDSDFIDNDNEGIDVSNVKVENATISGNGSFGVLADKAKLSNVDVLNNGFDAVYNYLHSTTPGIRVGGTLKMEDGLVSGNTLGGIAGVNAKVGLKNVEVSGNTGYGIDNTGKPTKLQDSMIVNNAGVGVDSLASTVKVQDTTISGNSTGIVVSKKKVLLLGASVTANSFFGIAADNGTGNSAKPAIVIGKGGIVAGNGTDPSCGVNPTVCADISAEAPPKFTYLAGLNECETSYVNGTGFPGVSWGICFFDCGNGAITGSETCDDGGESATCDVDCTAAMCGDGVANATAGEECDDGNVVSDDGCDATCILEFCGDGIIQPGIGEVCDDGAETATCDIDCTLPLCGDGIRNKQAGEKCDDGNTNNGDGCDSSCQKE